MLAWQVTIVTSSLFNFQRRRRLIRNGHCITVAPRSAHSPGGPLTLFPEQRERKGTLGTGRNQCVISTNPTRVTRLQMMLFYHVAPRHVWQVLLVRIHPEMVGMEMRNSLVQQNSLAIPSVPRDCQLGAKGAPPGFPLRAEEPH